MEEVKEKKKINWFTKPTWQDYVMLFVIAMAIVMFYFYRLDMASLKHYYETVCLCPTNIQANITNFSKLILPK